MNERHILRERQVWIAVVAALATTTAWLGILNLALLAMAHSAAWSGFWVLAKALARAAVLALQHGVALVPMGLAAVALVALLALALGRERRREGGVRHA